MTISVLTIMPDLFGSFLQAPVIARAIRNGVLEVEIIDIREYAPGSFRHIDDSPSFRRRCRHGNAVPAGPRCPARLQKQKSHELL